MMVMVIMMMIVMIMMKVITMVRIMVVCVIIDIVITEMHVFKMITDKTGKVMMISMIIIGIENMIKRRISTMRMIIKVLKEFLNRIVYENKHQRDFNFLQDTCLDAILSTRIFKCEV